jgi:hypothetical protein
MRPRLEFEMTQAGKDFARGSRTRYPSDAVRDAAGWVISSPSRGNRSRFFDAHTA